MKIFIALLIAFSSWRVFGQHYSTKLSEHTWIGTVGNLKVYLNFDVNGNMKAWSNLYPDCIAYSTYSCSVFSNNITTTWVSNSCGSSGTNSVFVYDEKSATPVIYLSTDSNMKYWASKKIPK
jgi:hypothetical protein